MVRAVIDHNVIVSAFIGRPVGIPYLIYQAIANEQVISVTSAQLIEELEEVLNRPRLAARHKLNREAVALAIDRYAQVCEFVSGQVAVNGVVADPDDDVLLAVALEGKVDYIVSGDEHLKEIGSFQGIKTITPHDFVAAVLGLEIP